MPKEDDDIIELTEVVEEEEGEDDDFMKELSDESFLTASEEPSNDSDIEGNDEVSAFFSSGGADLTEPEAPAASGPEPEAAASEEEASEEFDSFLVDLEEDLQQEQDAARPQEMALSEPTESLEEEEPEEILPIEPEPEEEAFLSQDDIDDLEKQWAQALDETSSEAPETEPEAEAPGLDKAAALSDLEPPVGADAAETLSVPPAIDQEELERTLERVVRGILEPIAERVFAEVAQELIAREIDRLKKDIEGLEE